MVMADYRQAPLCKVVHERKPGPGRPRSRAGCNTCKRRRIKCDETRPACQRCSRFGRKCEGYENGPFSVQPRLHEPAALRFRNEQEYRYFLLFSKMVAPCLSVYFKSNLWNGILLQVCESNQPTRYAAVAIGALRKIEELRQLPGNSSQRKLADAHAHYKFALRQYSLAVRLMQNQCIDRMQDLSIILVHSMAIICFETLHGNHDAALRQAIVGLGLLRRYNPRGNSTCPSNLDLDAELVRAFGCLNIGDISSTTVSLSAVYKLPDDSEQAGLERISSDFKTVQQARLELKQATQQRIEYTALTAPSHSMQCVKFDISEWLPEIYPPRDAYDSERRVPDTVSSVHSNSAEGNPDKEYIYDAMALEFLCQKNRFASAETIDSDRACTDVSKYLPIFSQIISSVRAVLDSQVESPNPEPFSLETQVIFPLHAVLKHCPDPGLRDEARELSRGARQSEFFRGGFPAGTLAEWVRLMAMTRWSKNTLST